MSFHNCLISNHTIIGSSVIGTFVGLATLSFFNITLENNTLRGDDTLPNVRPALIVSITASIYIDGMYIIGGGTQNRAMLLFVNIASGSIYNMSIKDFYRQDTGQASLLYISSSRFSFFNLTTSNTTGLFKVMGSTLKLLTSNIGAVQNLYNSQFLFDMFDTQLDVQNFAYQGVGKHGSLLPLIGGIKNSIQIRNAYFLNAVGAQNKVFSFESSKFFIITDTIFKYKKDLSGVTIFEFVSDVNVIIQRCIFSFPGSVVQAHNIQKGIYFLENTILTNSHMQNILLENTHVNYILYNNILRHGNISYASLPESQIEISDSLGLTRINKNNFVSLYGTYGIIEVSTDAPSYNISLEDNIFCNNLASNGGALYLSARGSQGNQSLPQVQIQRSIFVLNNAITSNQIPGKGGAIYQTTLNQRRQLTTINSTYFLNNSATSSGGALFIDYEPLVIDIDCIFKGNYASNSLNHIGSIAVQLIHFLNNTTPQITYIPGTKKTDVTSSSDAYKWSNVASGVKTNQTYTFVLLDMFNQVVLDDQASVLNIYPADFDENKRDQFTDQTSIAVKDGTYTLEAFTFNYQAQKAINVTFKSTAVPDPNTFHLTNVSVVPSVVVEVSFRKCGAGEYIVTDSKFSTCKTCPAGYWQVDPNAAVYSCSACNKDSTTCYGGNYVGVKHHYWRMNKTADIVTKCPRPESCIGSKEIRNQTTILSIVPVGSCADKYRGHLCAGCVEGWAKNNDQCINCSTNSVSYLLFAVKMIVNILLISFGVKETLQHNIKTITDEKKGTNNTNNTTLLRILISYSQTFSLIISIPVNWPNSLKLVMDALGKISFATDDSFSSECFFEFGKSFFRTEIIFLKVFFRSMIPFIFILMSIFFWVVYFKLTGKLIRGNKDLSSRIIATIVIICYDMQPGIIKDGFSLFRCTNLYRTDKPEEYLDDAYDIRCWEGQHFNWILGFALPSLLLWIIILPGLMLFTLRKNTKKLYSPEIAIKFSFLFQGYKQQQILLGNNNYD